MKPGHYISMAILLIFGCVGGYMFGSSSTRRDLEAQAIKGGHAVWRVTDEHGNVTFEWQANHPGEKLQKP